MFGNDRDAMRRYYCTVWEKANSGQPLEPLENIITSIIREHPEYQALLTKPHAAIAWEYTAEGGQTNPFLHMGMHIAIHEQLSCDRPPGILQIYQQLCQSLGNSHHAEHQMMECLGETLWESQRNGLAPDETVYLERLQWLVKKTG
ncbi:MAG: hypothetical protein CSA09_05015 [Candidatus Contendobacter odensis]|uniref:DUF1841 domain-containing protein n=1 Tax=Candidatus Contendibacter odensensis TaxID=1400860 RepID=A0A2G6PE37_9GAMM|nr:MAG: hypothetical protein CSA09_05015 [Candidatus Contendobacter odensis]